MDGASSWQTFRSIVLPAIAPTLVAVTILQTIGALQTFDVLFTLTRGVRGQDTTLAVYYIFTSAFRFLSFGYAAALSVILGLIIVLASAAILLLRRRPQTPVPIEDEATSTRRTSLDMSAVPALPPVLLPNEPQLFAPDRVRRIIGLT